MAVQFCPSINTLACNPDEPFAQAWCWKHEPRHHLPIRTLRCIFTIHHFLRPNSESLTKGRLRRLCPCSRLVLSFLSILRRVITSLHSAAPNFPAKQSIPHQRFKTLKPQAAIPDLSGTPCRSLSYSFAKVDRTKPCLRPCKNPPSRALKYAFRH